VKVSIIIPVYNEFSALPEVINRVLNARLPEGCTREVIVVDDGSNDGTTFLVNAYAGQGMLISHSTLQNGGKGTAIRTGLELASGDVILIQDGDMEYDPKDYVSLVAPIVNEHADVVYGSRFHGHVMEMPVWSLIANTILTFLANSLYAAHITDEATAYKAFRTEVLRSLSLQCRRFEFCPEVTAKLRRLGYRIHEVPISYRARRIAEGKKIRARDGVHAVWTLLKYRFIPREKFIRPVVGIIENTERPLA